MAVFLPSQGRFVTMLLGKLQPGLALGLGLLSIGRTWGVGQSAPPGEGAARILLETALDLGIRIFDTAPAYAASEARLGRFLRDLDAPRRSGLLIMTKAGEHWDHERLTSYVDHSRDGLVRSIDRSLALLGGVEVLQIHKATREVLHRPDVHAALDYARSCGIPAVGASVSDVDAGRAALETGLYDSVQFPLNRANESFLPLLPDLARKPAVPVVNRPFAMGALVADAGGFDAAARAAFDFLRRKVEHGIVLTGTGNATHLAENVRAFRDGAIT
jgi:aryl-alcohol dehydrogenase-like predicted oxidoreductase